MSRRDEGGRIDYEDLGVAQVVERRPKAFRIQFADGVHPTAWVPRSVLSVKTDQELADDGGTAKCRVKRWFVEQRL